MKGLKYKILWVDDNIENFIDLAVDEEFEVFLQNYAFDPEIIKCETAERALEYLNSDRKIDLILSDLNLTGGEQGDSLIKKIRDGEIFTEILFYSAQPEFESVAKELYTDRVSFLSLVGDEGNRLFKERVKRLIDLTISKLQELNNIRGLVMAETSELDTIIEDILIEIMLQESELTQALRKYMIEKITENNEKRTEALNDIDKLSNTEIIKNRLLFDANKKSRTLNEFLKKSKIVERKALFKDFHTNYEKDVLAVRNDLAHAKSDIIDGIEYLILSRKSGEQSVKIDQAECIKIRTSLVKYSGLLRDIRSIILNERE